MSKLLSTGFDFVPPAKVNTTHTRFKWELWRNGKRTNYSYEPTYAKACAAARKYRATARAFWKARNKTVELALYVQRVDTIEYDAVAL